MDRYNARAVHADIMLDRDFRALHLPRARSVAYLLDQLGRTVSWIIGLPARTPVDEAFTEPAPGINLKQKIGDFHAGSRS